MNAQQYQLTNIDIAALAIAHNSDGIIYASPDESQFIAQGIELGMLEPHGEYVRLTAQGHEWVTANVSESEFDADDDETPFDYDIPFVN